jgi:hypothetical protein
MICKNGQGTDGYRIYINRTRDIIGGEYATTTKVKFKCDDELHRTDGPAIVSWEGDFENVCEYYYIRGHRVHTEAFLAIFNTKYEDLPLLMNNGKYSSEIVKDKLNGRIIEVDLPKSDIRDEILKKLEVNNVNRRRVQSKRCSS